ncbi:MAG: hypothetical protein KF805_04420 [Phycisphaeraceae bacterium]|nr:hypothetical protein [Phycisphaeraceae bacterium]
MGGASAARGVQGVIAKPAVRLALFGFGAALFGFAIYTAWSGSSDGLRAFSRAVEHPFTLALLVFLPLVCLFLASMSFWVLTRRFGKVDVHEMLMLLGGAWLLNYLPFKPGVAGRVAYHKSVNGIDVRWSLVVVAQSIVIGLACFTAQIALASIAAERAWSEWGKGALLATPLGLAVLGVALPRRGIGANAWRYSAAFAFRYADSLVWAGRYWLLFWIAGRPQGLSTSAAIAGVSQSASLLPFAGNGLGVREWMVGLAARSLPEWYGKQTAMPVAYGVSAELLNRACEFAVAVPVGLLSLWWLIRRFGKARATESVAAVGAIRT